MKVKNYIAGNLKFLRTLSGLSQEQLAEKVELNRGNITSYERGVAKPNIEALKRITEFFNVDLINFIKRDVSQNITERRARGLSGKIQTPEMKLKSNDMMQTMEEASVMQNLVGNMQQITQYDWQMKQRFYNDMQTISGNIEKLTGAVNDLIHLNKELQQEINTNKKEMPSATFELSSVG
ncbi:MAG: helix-turn-helix domain-containing protein [Chitinophagales bacterium]